MAKLLIPPDNSSYNASRTGEILSSKVAGGPSRMRQDVIGSPFIVDVSWQLDPDEFDYINAFFRTTAKRGAYPFEIDLILEDAALVEYTARFVPDSFKLSGQKGLTYYVGAQLEVESPVSPTEATEDAATIAAFATQWAIEHP